MYFILVKISNYRALNTQKRQNGGILGGYDVIGGPLWGRGSIFFVNFFSFEFFDRLKKISSKSDKRFRSSHFWGPPSGQSEIFTGWAKLPKGSPRPKLGWYQVWRKSLEPFLRAPKLLDFGQNLHISPCGDKYTCAHVVSTKTKFAFSINFFRFAQEIDWKSKFLRCNSAATYRSLPNSNL